MAKKVKPLKIEKPIRGQEVSSAPTDVDSDNDYLTGKGFSFGNSDGHTLDLDDAGNIVFKDGSQPSGKTLKSVVDSVSTEISDRVNAVSSLQTLINSEATSRSNTDASLQNQINSEVSARTTADTGLQTQINTEITDRGNAVTGLQTQITNIVNNFASTVRSTILTGISFTTQTAITASDSVLSALGKLQGQLNLRAVSTTPNAIGSANNAGTSSAFARADHVHEGIHSVNANGGTNRFGDISLLAGSKSIITDNNNGSYSFESLPDFRISVGTGLTVNYNGGYARVNGTLYNIPSGTLAVTANLTNNRVYVDVDGVIKFTATTLPPFTYAMGSFTSNATNVTAVTDSRQFIGQAIQFGVPSNTGSANAQGSSWSLARADHVHNTTLADYSVTSTVNTTTTSTTPVLVSGMTITPVAGKYLVLGGSSFQSTTNGAEIDVLIYSGGTALVGSKRTLAPKLANQDPATTPRPINVAGIVTVDGTQAIEMRWDISAGTATARERSLSLIRIG